MIARLFQPLRFALHLVVLAAACLTLSTADADDANDGAVTSCPIELEGTEELCGWVELGTHDSGALPSPAAGGEKPGATAPLGPSFHAIASAACASVGVSVQQLVEPFAMAGPCVKDSLESVQRLQRWWAQTAAAAEVDRSGETPTDLQAQIEAIASEEPIDIEYVNFEGLGPSVLVEEFSDEVIVDVEVTRIDPLIGSSPMIATIEEAYLPYDLTPRDLKLWSVLPSSPRPFCIRSHGDPSPLWREFDQLVDRDPIRRAPQVAYCGPADCYLEELFWTVETWAAEDSPLWAAVAPAHLGRQMATWVASGNRLITGAAQLLASRWPPAEETFRPSPAGEALLARAGAIEASRPLDVEPPALGTAPLQIAEISTGGPLR